MDLTPLEKDGIEPAQPLQKKEKDFIMQPNYSVSLPHYSVGPEAYSLVGDIIRPYGTRVAVVGGGNVAMDAARCAKRMGASEVYIIYRRSLAELPARAEEVHHAMEEGIIFKLLNNPVQILGDENGHVRAIECVEMELGEPDASGRRKPIVKEGSNFEIPVDMVIMSIGTKLNTLILDTTDHLEANKKGGIGTDDGAATNREGIFAGGDAVTGAATVIKAMGAGKTAAASIDAYLSAK